jgi:hypothetical protein
MYYLNYEPERVDSIADVSAPSEKYSSTVRPSQANGTPTAVASSDQDSSSIRTSVAAPSAPNRHIESSKEPSNEPQKQSFSLSKDREKDKNLIQYDEAKQLFGKLSEAAFGDPLHETEWPREMEELLKQGLPIKRQNWELIDWFYRLSADHEIFTVTYRRQSLRAVIQNLRSEPQKIRSARRAIELEEYLSASQSEALRTGWTVQLREAAREEFPELTLPERYDMMPADMQQRVAKRIALYEAGWHRFRINACKTEFPDVAERAFRQDFETLPWDMKSQIESRAMELWREERRAGEDSN